MISVDAEEKLSNIPLLLRFGKGRIEVSSQMRHGYECAVRV